VALKVIKAGMDTKQVIGRFEAERQALALMDHPAIAKVYEAGETPRRLPYFAMEYVAGEAITTYCDRQRLTTQERLDLLRQVCEGVQHAHQKGVIHRDLKPSNVLVTIQDGKPVPKIIDFGVAKATAQRLTEKTLFTELGVLIGTPEYVSPEQAEMTGLDVDTRTDVYALGVMLYELLTGALPFESKELREAGYEEIRRRIREVDPPRPSTRVRTLGARSTEAAKNRGTEPGKLVSRLKGDLDWIVMKALEKDRTRRYGSPSELAADIGRHLGYEPVLAGPPSTTYRAGKFVRRHRFGVAIACVAVAGLLAFGVVMGAQARKIARERDRAERVSEFLVDLFKVSDPSEARGNAITAREVLDKGADKIEKDLASEPDVQGQVMATMGDVYFALGLTAKAERFLDKAVELRRRLQGPEAPETLRVRSHLGKIYERQGRYSEAEKLLLEVWQAQRSILGPDHPDTLTTLAVRGFLTYRQGRYAEAEGIDREVAEARRRLLGEDHPETLRALEQLAVAYEKEGKYAEAEKLDRQVLEAKRRVLGEDHPSTLWSMNNLAAVLQLQGQKVQAETLYRQGFEGMRRVLGKDHPDTLWVENNLADTLDMEGRSDEAEKIYVEVLEARRRVLGPDNPRTMATMHNLAGVWVERKHYAEAEKLYRQVLEENRRVLGPEHPNTLYAMTNLGTVCAMQQRYDEGERLEREALDVERRVLGPRHPDTLSSMMGLAELEAMRGRRAATLDWLKQSVEAGYDDVDELNNDSGLKTLSGDPEFERLVAAVRENAAKKSPAPR